MVSQTLLRASVASRTQSWGEGALPEAGEGFVSAELGRYRLSSLSGCCPMRMLQWAQKVNPKTPKNMRSCENHGLAFRAGRKTLHNGVGETHPLSEFLAGLRSGF